MWLRVEVAPLWLPTCEGRYIVTYTCITAHVSSHISSRGNQITFKTMVFDVLC